METLDLNDDELKALSKKLGAGVKTEEELVNLTKTLRKSMIEATLGSEMTEHLATRSTLLMVTASTIAATEKAKR